VVELGLSKKRYSTGNYYYGISEKEVKKNDSNIFTLLNVEKIPDNVNVENYNKDVFNVISKMENELNTLKKKISNIPEKEKETIYSKNNELKIGIPLNIRPVSSNSNQYGSSQNLCNKPILLRKEAPNPNIVVSPWLG
jgi:hypothetical protein